MHDYPKYSPGVILPKETKQPQKKSLIYGQILE